MEYILLVVIVLQFGYMVFQEISHYKERENMRVMLKSENVSEYKAVQTMFDNPPESEEEGDEIVPLHEVSFSEFQENS